MNDAERRAPPRVLLVEDSQADATMLLEALREIEVAVTVDRCDHGDRALEALRLATPSLVVLDLGLPGRSGEDILRALRGDPATLALPVVVLTGSPSRSDEARCRDLGADAFFVKPATPDGYVALGRALARGFLRAPPAA